MRRQTALLLLPALLLALAGCTSGSRPAAGADHPIRIGFAMDTLQDERWQRDRDLFVAAARARGAEVIVQAASGDDYLQMAQAEDMLNRGVDVLVVVPHDADALAPIVNRAHAAGVKVVAYDRLVMYAAVDFYVSFDSEETGRLQAAYLTARVPKGNYVYIGGAPSDHNASLLQHGSMTALAPSVSAGDIRVVYSEMTPEWDPETARIHMASALAQVNGQVDAVIAANDGTASGAILALQAAGLAGRVPVVGQDADLAALRRIVQGTQAMTVYKPLKGLAEKAVDVAMALAKGKPPAANASVSNGVTDVPAYLLQPVVVDKTNWRQTVVRDGFHSEQDILGIQ